LSERSLERGAGIEPAPWGSQTDKDGYQPHNHAVPRTGKVP
jgi:hypothetical protein